MRRMLAVVGAALALAAITTGVVFALNYEGEDFCQDTPAWPGGTYLGQMHPYHSDFYRGYAERRGWDPCTTWAADQRRSAIRGLRELGYTVIDPAAPSESAPVSTDPTVGLSRENPVPLGTPFRGSNWELTVQSVTPNATAAVLEENQFNDPPEAGHQFSMVRIKVVRIAPGSARFDASGGLRAVGDEGIAYATFRDSCGVIPDEFPSYTEVFSGGSVEGSECWQIRQADAGSLVMFIGDGEARLWFSLQ